MSPGMSAAALPCMVNDTRPFRLVSRPHPRVLPMWGVVTTDPTSFGIVIEHCGRGDVRKLLNERHTHLSNKQKLQILKDIAEVSMDEVMSLSLTLIFRPALSRPFSFTR